MNKTSKTSITSKQLNYIIIGTMIGIGAFRMPANLAKITCQDAWIAAALGGSYPLLIVVLSTYFMKKFPSKNVLALSKEYLGIILGSILNLLFAVGFIIHLTTIGQGLSNLLVASIMNFISIYKMLIVLFFIAAYTANKELKLLGRVNTVVFFFTIILSSILLAGIRDGSLTNIMPVFGSGFLSILKAAQDSMSSYTGVEILLLIYPFVSDKDKSIRQAFMAVIITIIIYTWFVFISIYFCGPDLVIKYMWPVLTVSKSIEIPVISNFRFLFLGLWIIIVFKTISNSFYAVTLSLKSVFTKPSFKIISVFVFILCIAICIWYKDETGRRQILKYSTPIILIYNITYILIIITVIYLKQSRKKVK